MKRFITYLYEYEGGQKTKNTGFIRAEERNGKAFFQISVRNFIRSRQEGEIYAFIWKNKLTGIKIGALSILNSPTDVRMEFDAKDIWGTGETMDAIVGLGIVFPNHGYMASCWNDSYAENIGNGEFAVWKEETKPQAEMPEPPEPPEEEASLLQASSYDLVAYQKMELNAIKSLPSPNWYLCNNRFLVHGFFNYGYLVLKKTVEDEMERTYLGVPGIYEKPEMVMATFFGFSEFQTLPKEVSEAKMEEIISVRREEEISREPKGGTFGCWLIPIQS